MTTSGVGFGLDTKNRRPKGRQTVYKSASSGQKTTFRLGTHIEEQNRDHTQEKKFGITRGLPTSFETDIAARCSFIPP